MKRDGAPRHWAHWQLVAFEPLWWVRQKDIYNHLNFDTIECTVFGMSSALDWNLLNK